VKETKSPYYHYKEKAEKATGLYAYIFICTSFISHFNPASVKKEVGIFTRRCDKANRYIAQRILGKKGIQC
jgi:hypothetical protein